MPIAFAPDPGTMRARLVETRVYLYPPDLVQQLERAWARTRLYPAEEAPPALPSAPILRRLLDVAYNASLMTEEHRRPRFRLVWCPQAELDNGSGRPRGAAPIRFAQPCVFDERQLLQLAPATDPASVLIAVEQDPAGMPGDEPRLRIWGLLDTGSSWWGHVRGEADRSVAAPPDLLALACGRPGQLILMRAWRVLLALEEGRLIHRPADVFVRGPIAGHFDRVIAELDRAVQAQVPQAEALDAEVLRYNCAVKYMTTLKRLLTYFVDQGHGGILILLPSQDESLSRLWPLALVKYRCADYNLWECMRRGLELRQRWIESGVRIASETSCTRNEIIERSRLRTALDEQEYQLTDRLHLVAALSGVDGALLLSDELRVLGFGAELRSQIEVGFVYQALDAAATQRLTVRPDSFGTRHRSAFRLCAQLPDAVAFVLSQDGGMRAVKSVEGEVVYWDVSPPND